MAAFGCSLVKLGMLRGGAAGDGGLKALRELTEIVTRARERTESLTFQLSPPILHDVGLGAAAEWLAEEMGRSYGLRVRVEREAELPLDERIRVTLFRALRRFHGVTPRECRRAPDGLAFMGGIGTAGLTPSLESG